MSNYYETLQDFIANQMRMSHIYQPSVLLTNLTKIRLILYLHSSLV